MVVGGGDLAAAFRRHDLIDEYRLYVHPIVIGRGKPLFALSDARIDLRLAETRSFARGWSCSATSATGGLVDDYYITVYHTDLWLYREVVVSSPWWFAASCWGQPASFY